jgi:6-phospho-3-hexuloisomerase
MQTVSYTGEILKELERTLRLISDEEAEQLMDAILEAKQVFVAGAGRSGLMARSFAMRLMHMGINAYVVGETITPGVEKNDLLLVASGSGETQNLVSMAQKAKHLEARVALVTILPQSTLGQAADITVQIPAKPKDDADVGNPSIQPMGSLFEQSLLLLFDAVILRIMEKKGLISSTMYGRHANLE